MILAAGIDTRAYRLSFSKGARVFELDRQEVLDYKQEKLSNLQSHCATLTLQSLGQTWDLTMRTTVLAALLILAASIFSIKSLKFG